MTLTAARDPTMPSKRAEPEERGVGCLGTHIWVPTDSSCVRSEVREGRGLTTPKNNCPACLKSRQRSRVCVGRGDPKTPTLSSCLLKMEKRQSPRHNKRGSWELLVLGKARSSSRVGEVRSPFGKVVLHCARWFFRAVVHRGVLRQRADLRDSRWHRHRCHFRLILAKLPSLTHPLQSFMRCEVDHGKR